MHHSTRLFGSELTRPPALNPAASRLLNTCRIVYYTEPLTEIKTCRLSAGSKREKRMQQRSQKLVIWIISVLLLIAPFSASLHALVLPTATEEMPCHYEQAGENCCTDLALSAGCNCCEQASPAGLMLGISDNGTLMLLSDSIGDLRLPPVSNPLQYPPYRPPIDSPA